VLKGPNARGKELEDAGEPQLFRERDQLRDGTLTLMDHKSHEEFEIRAIEITRPDSRNPIVYFFITNVSEEVFKAPEIAEAYLGRWPNQENVIRELRQGAGFNHSHGYGRVAVSNVALLGLDLRLAVSS
jgi:hypothetical protein